GQRPGERPQCRRPRLLTRRAARHRHPGPGQGLPVLARGALTLVRAGARPGPRATGWRRPHGALALALALTALLLAGCASQTRTLLASPPAGLPPTVELERTPYFEQADFQCGPASLSMALGAAGFGTRPEDLIGRVFVPERQGSLQI